jgi:hypothetical protein
MKLLFSAGIYIQCIYSVYLVYIYTEVELGVEDGDKSPAVKF